MTSNEKLRFECLKLCYAHGRSLPETLGLAKGLEDYVRRGKQKEASLVKSKQNWLQRIKRLTTPEVKEGPTGQSESR